MAYSDEIADEIRKTLGHIQHVEEKKMFGSLAFLVNGKMCLTAGPNRMMCRINPQLHDQEVQKEGCSAVVKKGHEYKGYVYINEERMKDKNDLRYWVTLALEFNARLTEK